MTATRPNHAQAVLRLGTAELHVYCYEANVPDRLSCCSEWLLLLLLLLLLLPAMLFV
jgi:hypothetical protein